MATPAQRASEAHVREQIAQRIPGEKSSLPLLVLIAGWLLPGAGHLILGKWVRAALLFLSILGMFLVGLGLSAKVYVPETGDILNLLGFVGQLGLGGFYVLLRFMGWGASTVTFTAGDWGTKFLLAAGLLNFISAIDAHSLANGRKAS
jgi:hypothetical protein